MDNLEENKIVLERGIKKQLESLGETLQMVYLNKECPQDIANILFNQIGIAIMCSKELDQYLQLINSSNKK